ncbi:MAG: glycoside hydrolase family 88 protein [Chitinophagaceae bacterium]|nr:glycoside hydrolase family 88 protein [Chitinophagaceae bacterium]
MRYLFSFLIIVFFAFNSKAQKLPSKASVIKTMELANGYFMQKWPDTKKDIFVPSKNRSWPSHIWTRAVYYEGLMALYSVDKKKQFYDYAVDWGTQHNWGLRDGIKTRNGDNQVCGQTYIDLYLIDKKEERIKDIKASMDSMVLSQKKDDWWWVDALQMAMPVFTRLGVIYKDTNYFHKMYDMYAFTKYNHGGKGLYNAEDHLWWRDKDFVPPYKEPNGEDCYWSRGNGWVVAALVRTLQMLPKKDPHYKEYLQDYKDMCKALLPLQRKDGTWNVSLHDSTHFGGKEITGTSLFIYGFAWGINNGLLNKNTYLPAIVKAWNEMSKTAVHTNGFLGFVQGTGKEPKDSQPVAYDHEPDFEDFGLGCFLLAGSEVFKLK